MSKRRKIKDEYTVMDMYIGIDAIVGLLQLLEKLDIQSAYEYRLFSVGGGWSQLDLGDVANRISGHGSAVFGFDE